MNEREGKSGDFSRVAPDAEPLSPASPDRGNNSYLGRNRRPRKTAIGILTGAFALTMCVLSSVAAIGSPEAVAVPIVRSAEAAGVPSKPSVVGLLPAKRVQENRSDSGENPNDPGTDPVDHKKNPNDSDFDSDYCSGDNMEECRALAGLKTPFPELSEKDMKALGLGAEGKRLPDLGLTSYSTDTKERVRIVREVFLQTLSVAEGRPDLAKEGWERAVRLLSYLNIYVVRGDPTLLMSGNSAYDAAGKPQDPLAFTNNIRLELLGSKSFRGVQLIIFNGAYFDDQYHPVDTGGRGYDLATLGHEAEHAFDNLTGEHGGFDSVMIEVTRRSVEMMGGPDLFTGALANGEVHAYGTSATFFKHYGYGRPWMEVWAKGEQTRFGKLR